MALRLVDEPADVVGNSFGQPAGGLRSVGIGAAGAAVLLNDVDNFVEDSSHGFAFEVAAEPFSGASDARSACGRHASHVLAESDAETFGSFKPFAGQQLNYFRVPFPGHGCQLFVRPIGQAWSFGGVDSDLE